jgi:SAM-dependent methyltransferase
MTLVTTTSARDAYAPLAVHYDLLTRGYKHARWLHELEALALGHGLTGRRLLDVACGTGKSMLPLLAKGYEVTGCDVSEQMLAVAAARVPPATRLVCADMRALPSLGQFDLITCLDDSVNYLLGDSDLVSAMQSMRDQLAPGGVLIFDVNSSSGHRDSYESAWVAQDDGVFLCWHGDGCDEPPSLLGTASIEIFEAGSSGVWRRATSTHTQRHWGQEAIRAGIERSGLRLRGIYGQLRGGVLEPRADELRHPKHVYVASHDSPPSSDEGRCAQ